MFKTVRDFDVNGRRVLVRADFNVPLSKKGEILDDFRIKASIRTISRLLDRNAKIILMSHLGRPEGKVVEELRLTPVQDRLMDYLDVSITKAPDCIGIEIEQWTKEMANGEILLLENLRFHKEEEDNDNAFAKELSRLGDIYINDAFGASHRSHASIVGVPKYLHHGSGLLLEKEVNILSSLLKSPKRPLVVIIGGAKAETKSKVIDAFIQIADTVLLGNLIAKEVQGNKAVKPLDGGRDIGPRTAELFKNEIAKAKTVFWSGPLGKIEEKEFQKGSLEIAKSIIESRAFSVAGGGETAGFLNSVGLGQRFNHLSTGGGAMLEFLSGKKLPGLEALVKK